MPKKAIILLSGGLDSTTCLAIAQEQGFECYTLSFNYDQRHRHELAQSALLSRLLGAKEHRELKVPLAEFGGSALTDHRLAVPHERSADVPITYVPARNTIFLSLALAWAEVLGAHDIFYGANIVDYSNYPDCRPEYMEAFMRVANLATRAGIEGAKLTIHTPLIRLSKADIIREGARLQVPYEHTISCYDPTEDGAACGKCDPCYFRAKGFREAGIPDVTRYKK